MKYLNYFSILIFIIFLSSCTNKEGIKIEAFPFANTDQTEWGLVDINGKIILEGEWSSEPSVMIDGLIYIANDKDLYEFYSVGNEIKQIGEEYVAVTHFSDGWAAVVVGEKPITYINKKGEVKLTLDKKIAQAGPFFNGLARVKTNDNKWGFINKKGEFVIEAKYDGVSYFSDGLVLAVEEVDAEDQYKYYFSFLDKNGKIVLDLKDEYETIGNFSEGFAYVYGTEDGLGFINKKGEIVIERDKEITDVQNFKDGYAVVAVENKYGLINTKGEKIIKPKYENTLFFDNGLITFSEEGKVGFLNINGDEIVEAQYKEVLPFLFKNTIVQDQDDKYYYIDNKGEKISDQEFEYIPLYSIMGFYYNNKFELVEASSVLKNKIVGEWTLKKMEIVNIDEFGETAFENQMNNIEIQLTMLEEQLKTLEGSEKDTMQSQIDKLKTDKADLSPDKIKNDTQDMLDDLIGQITFNFEANGTVTIGPFQTKQWTINDETKTLTLISENENDEMVITELSSDQMVLSSKEIDGEIVMEMKMIFSKK